MSDNQRRFTFKHLQPSQYEGWLRRAEGANRGDDDFFDWDEMGREYRACCNFALELQGAIAKLQQLRASHEELLKALSSTVGYMHNAAIDLVTGVKKSVAKNTLDGGIIRAEEAIANAQKVKE